MGKSSKWGIIVLSLVIISMTFHTEAVYSKSNQPKVVFKDRFNDGKLDKKNWSYLETTYYNHEKAYYSPKNVKEKEGHLIFTAERNKNNPDKKPFISGAVQSKKAFRYGRVVARMKLPVGQGYWPAFWLLPKKDTYGTWPASGEIDIMEARGQDNNLITGTLHFGKPDLESENASTFVEANKRLKTTFGKWHTYSVEWSPKAIKWLVDGKVYHTQTKWYSAKPNGKKYPSPAPFDQKFYVIMNLTVGGDYVDDQLPTKKSGQMLIDYVKVTSTYKQ